MPRTTLTVANDVPRVLAGQTPLLTERMFIYRSTCPAWLREHDDSYDYSKCPTGWVKSLQRATRTYNEVSRCRGKCRQIGQPSCQQTLLFLTVFWGCQIFSTGRLCQADQADMRNSARQGIWPKSFRQTLRCTGPLVLRLSWPVRRRRSSRTQPPTVVVENREVQPSPPSSGCRSGGVPDSDCRKEPTP